jgi:methanol--5-hydroxybenzimidazolylcobamide Co-methyltransferase
MEKLAIKSANLLVFGACPKPVRCGNNLIIGDGIVHPEVNFTLPAMSINAETWSEIIRQYNDIGKSITLRMVKLRSTGIVLEFELLPTMTEEPKLGAEITGLLHGCLRTAYERHGLKSALRVTPADIRRTDINGEGLRTGLRVNSLLRSFEQCASNGAHILSIESIGGKELHDKALLNGDMRGIAFSLGVLAPRDMAWLWDKITLISHRYNVIPGGDTACGFANTAMQLAEKGYLPDVLAAVVRAMSAARSLVAYEHGAVGPSKDCAYEGPIIKVITGVPISMEGKSSCCAHFSPVGNIAAAACDLWSNESVQNVPLLSGNAPEVFSELLTYDTRLMNAAYDDGQIFLLRDLMVRSDVNNSLQAYLLSPEATFEIASAIVKEQDPYRRTVAAGIEAVKLLKNAVKELGSSQSERKWLDKIDNDLQNLPEVGEEMLDEMMSMYPNIFIPANYGFFQ